MSDEPPTERFDRPQRDGQPAPDATQAYPRQPNDPTAVPPPRPPEATRAYSAQPTEATRAFSQGSADPAELFPPQQPLPAHDGGTAPERRSRALLVTLICVGAALLIAIIVLLCILLARNTGSDTVASPAPTTSTAPSASSPSSTPSTTPSTTPSSSPTATTPPPAPLNITSFSVSTTTVTCTGDGGQQPPLTFSWSSTGATEVYFGVNTADASSDPTFSSLPPSGNSSSFPAGENPYGYACPAPSTSYTLTIVGNGQKSSQTITVENDAPN